MLIGLEKGQPKADMPSSLGCGRLDQELPPLHESSTLIQLICVYFLPCRADLFSESQRIQYTIHTKTQGIPDARSYLEALKEIRIRYVPA